MENSSDRMSEKVISWNPALRPNSVVKSSSLQASSTSFNEPLTSHDPDNGQQRFESTNAESSDGDLLKSSDAPDTDSYDTSVDPNTAKQTLAVSSTEDSIDHPDFQQSWLLQSESTDPFSQVDKVFSSQKDVSEYEDGSVYDEKALSSKVDQLNVSTFSSIAPSEISQPSGGQTSNIREEERPESIDRSSAGWTKERSTEIESEPFASLQDTWELEDPPKSPVIDDISKGSLYGTDDEWGLSEHRFDIGSAVNVETPILHAATTEPNDVNTAKGVKNSEMGSALNDDLAEMWKAALGDEDFLEEQNHTSADDLVPNKGVNSVANEPWLGANTEEEMQASRASNQNLYGTSVSFDPRINNTHNSSWNHTSSAANHSQAQLPSLISRAESYSDKSKGGYHSPYDLPVSLTKARKRPSINPSLTTTGTTHGRNGPAAPPPRSSSIAEYPSQSTLSSEVVSPGTSISNSTSQRLPPNGNISAYQPNQTAAPNMTGKASADFFADLPSAPKPRQSSTGGRYASQGLVRTPTAPPPSSQTSQALLSESEYHIRPSNPPASQTITADRLSPPLNIPTLTSRQTTSSIPQVSKYSPVPTPVSSQTQRYSQMPQVPTIRANKYSPAPSVSASKDHSGSGHPNLPQAIQAAQPFAPRTSSPLTHGSVLSAQPLGEEAELSKPSPDPNSELIYRGSSPSMVGALPEQLQHATNATHNTAEAVLPQRPERSVNQTPPRVSMSATSSPKKLYVPEKASWMQQTLTDSVTFSPLGEQNQISRRTMVEPHQTSSEPTTAPLNVYTPEASTTVRVSSHQRRRTITQGLEFVRPNDSRAGDPLERWRGCPIFHWGLGGSVLLHFPQQVPRYGAGHAIPMIQCTPGEVAVHNIKTLNPLPESITSFPGPLKGKSKKKDVSNWLHTTIKSMTAELEASNLDNLLPSDVRQRTEEKILLWKIMQILVDYNGVLEGSPEVNEVVARCLAESEPTDNMAGSIQDDSRYAAYQNDHASPQVIQEIRSNLLQGEREKAVWYAADQGLWAHAMLISSTIRKDVWKQVIQEFARQDVKKAGKSAESLAALYQVFAGNWEESIDELVPPSERAGFQMVRKDTTAPARNALQGLERWRETVRLIMNNRSNEDHRALHALGKLLATYGRPEAAHICYLFAGSLSRFGGPDDPQADVVLIGAEHLNQKLELDLNLDGTLLTEVYEYTLTLASSSASPLPYLQMFKLQHSMVLAENGYRNEAQQYCDAISAAIKATSRPSPYYHSNLITQLDDLSKRLSKSPKDSSASWIPKPSMEKVSGSMWAKFNNFVAGDDREKEPNSPTFAAQENVGPFTNLSGTPPNTLSQPAGSIHPLYSSSPQQPPSFAPPSSSRYTPVPSQPYSTFIPVPGDSSDTQQRASPPNQSHQSGTQPLTGSTYSQSPQLSHNVTSFYPINSPRQQMHNEPSLPQSQAYGMSNNESAPISVDVTEQTPFQATPNFIDSRQSYFPDSHAANSSRIQTNGEDGPTNNVEDGSHALSTAGYVPPTSSYEPPAYQPYLPDVDYEEKSQTENSTAKPIEEGDDDDELMRRAAALTKQQSFQADKEADDAFRKAAEADAVRARQISGDKKGWFGSWFKRGASDGAPSQGPIKAKLGEENSFYYDPNLKKWINKKAGADAAFVAAPSPPPPKGPPSRSSSAAPRPGGRIPLGVQPPLPSSTPPPPKMPSMAQLGAGSRSGTPVHAELPAAGAECTANIGADITTVSELAPPTISAQASASAPPSRPGTAMSTASSIDDLIGAPAARKGGTLKKGKKGRGYIDVMAK